MGCKRGASGSDPSYQKARTLYQELYASELDDAYGDPRMVEVEGLLEKVGRRSPDAGAAEAMLRSIQHGREELARQAAERQKMAAAIAPPRPIDIDPAAVLAAAHPDAGQDPGSDPYAPGTPVAALSAASGGCLVSGEPFSEQGTGVTGTVYRLSNSSSCAAQAPTLVGRVILVSGGRIYRRYLDSAPPAAADAGAGGASVRSQ
jgi:hypothetical protein